MIGRKRRYLKLKATKYMIWDDKLFKRVVDGTCLRCVDKQQEEKMLKTFHNEACIRHFSSLVMAFKILCQCYYWPNMFKDAYSWVSKCEKCKIFMCRPQLDTLPLRIVFIKGPFQQWDLDFIGPINPTSSVGHRYVITATDYFTKWVEEKETKKTTFEVVCEFIKENILVKFGVPTKLVMDKAMHFSSFESIKFCFEYGIIVSHSSKYFPQGNGQAESSSKNLMNTIKKLVL